MLQYRKYHMATIILLVLFYFSTTDGFLHKTQAKETKIEKAPIRNIQVSRISSVSSDNRNYEFLDRNNNAIESRRLNYDQSRRFNNLNDRDFRSLTRSERNPIPNREITRNREISSRDLSTSCPIRQTDRKDIFERRDLLERSERNENSRMHRGSSENRSFNAQKVENRLPKEEQNIEAEKRRFAFNYRNIREDSRRKTISERNRQGFNRRISERNQDSNQRISEKFQRAIRENSPEFDGNSFSSRNIRENQKESERKFSTQNDRLVRNNAISEDSMRRNIISRAPIDIRRNRYIEAQNGNVENSRTFEIRNNERFRTRNSRISDFRNIGRKSEDERVNSNNIRSIEDFSITSSRNARISRSNTLSEDSRRRNVIIRTPVENIRQSRYVEIQNRNIGNSRISENRNDERFAIRNTRTNDIRNIRRKPENERLISDNIESFGDRTTRSSQNARISRDNTISEGSRRRNFISRTTIENNRRNRHLEAGNSDMNSRISGSRIDERFRTRDARINNFRDTRRKSEDERINLENIRSFDNLLSHRNVRATSEDSRKRNIISRTPIETIRQNRYAELQTRNVDNSRISENRIDERSRTRNARISNFINTRRITERERIVAQKVRSFDDRIRIVENSRIRQDRDENSRIRQNTVENSRVRQDKVENSRIRQGRVEHSGIRQDRVENSRIRQDRVENSRIRQDRVENSRVINNRIVDSRRRFNTNIVEKDSRLANDRTEFNNGRARSIQVFRIRENRITRESRLDSRCFRSADETTNSRRLNREYDQNMERRSLNIESARNSEELNHRKAIDIAFTANSKNRISRNNDAASTERSKERIVQKERDTGRIREIVSSRRSGRNNIEPRVNDNKHIMRTRREIGVFRNVDEFSRQNRVVEKREIRRIAPSDLIRSLEHLKDGENILHPNGNYNSWLNIANMVLLTVSFMHMLQKSNPKKFGLNNLTNLLTIAKNQKIH